jgi:hypothetical protein
LTDIEIALAAFAIVALIVLEILCPTGPDDTGGGG